MQVLKTVTTAAVLAAGLVAAAQAQDAKQDNKPDFSVAERLLFMDDQLSALPRPATLKYAYRKSGSLEDGFEDTLQLAVKKQADGTCCAVEGDFAAAEHRLKIPEVPAATSNPATMFFLERDIREMQRLTKGQANYYRKRIRLAVYNKASVTDVTVNYKGKPVAAKQIEISPYDDDPNRPRFEKFARKSYVFTMAEKVPGGVYAIRSVTRSDSADAVPLLVEEMSIEGAEPAVKTAK